MKKDYEVVAPSDLAQDETGHIRGSWTTRWAGSDLPSADAVAQREEFRMMSRHFGRLPKVARLLDGGCGLGEWTVFLTGLGHDVVGIDISDETIRRLNEALPGYPFMCRDIRDTGFPDASFDAYFSWGTFEHFELGMESCLREAHRLLRPRGLLFASVPFQNWRHLLRDRGPLDTWDETYDRERGYEAPHRFYQWRFTRPEFQRELELRGFRVLELSPIGKRHGVNRWLQWDVPWLGRSRLIAAASRRVFTFMLPAAYIAHMLWAVAERVDGPN